MSHVRAALLMAQSVFLVRLGLDLVTQFVSNAKVDSLFRETSVQAAGLPVSSARLLTHAYDVRGTHAE